MTRLNISHTIDSEVLRSVEHYREKNFPGAPRSYVVEHLLRIALRMERKRLGSDTDIAVAR